MYMVKDRTFKTTLSFYSLDQKIIDEAKEEFKKEDTYFNTAEFFRSCLRNRKYVEHYKEETKLGIKY